VAFLYSSFDAALFVQKHTKWYKFVDLINPLPVPELIAFAHSAFSRFLPLLFITILSCPAQAQLCNGSLGDPVVNITFDLDGSGSSSIPPGYTYNSSSCPDDGSFTITSSTSNCFGNTWYTVPADHTGNGGFMLVNASFTPGDFFVTTVTDLCPNTTYEFASWIMNVLNRPGGGIAPNITFRIEKPDGTVLKVFNTGNIPPNGASWTQYGFFFITPADNAVIILRMTNNAPGGIGNDLALDDITFRPCGEMVRASIQGNTNIVDICEGNTSTYILEGNVSSNYQSPVYRWQSSTDKGKTWKDIPGATSTSYLRNPVISQGNYWYRLTVVEATVSGLSSCRIASNIIIINVHGKPMLDAGPDRIVLTGNSTFLAGKAEGDSMAYLWSPDMNISDIKNLVPTVSPEADITYTLSAVSKYGCTNEDQAFVKVVKGIYVPTAFTPNNDGKNDSWRIPFLDPAFGGDVSVFNRYGQLVYHVTGDIVSWDGTLNGIPQATGTYVYLISFKTASLKLKGTVTIIR
jgi:gliding motility-associated-like protein